MGLTAQQIRRLADQVRDKILEKTPFLSHSSGIVVIKAHPKGDGFDIELEAKSK